LRWHPNNPNLLCAGCFNGQLALWDLRKHRDALKDDGSVNEQVNLAVQLALEIDNNDDGVV
jgi:hypothetical protein